MFFHTTTVAATYIDIFLLSRFYFFENLMI